MTTSQASLEDTTSNVKRLTNKAVEGNPKQFVTFTVHGGPKNNLRAKVTFNSLV